MTIVRWVFLSCACVALSACTAVGQLGTRPDVSDVSDASTAGDGMSVRDQQTERTPASAIIRPRHPMSGNMYRGYKASHVAARASI